jgi:hypothetical protein
LVENNWPVSLFMSWSRIWLLAAASSAWAAPAPGWFDSGRDNQAGLVFSPDGTSAYWVAWNGGWGREADSPRTIYTSTLVNDSWGQATVMPFSGEYNDDDPFVSPDGRWLYFVSERPADEADTAADGDIWRFSLTGDDALEHLDINSAAAEYSPVITSTGAIYFASSRAGGSAQGDLFRAAANADGFDAPEPLGPALNSPTGEWNLWVSADETEILFEASSRPSNISEPGDLYYSRQTPAGWTAALPVASLNGDRSDLLPRLHPDGRTLYYTTAPIGGSAGIRSADWRSIKTEIRSSFAATLLVANRSSHEVVFVDLFEAAIIDRIATGEGPHLLSNVDQGRVAVTGFGEYPRPHIEPVNTRPPFDEALNSRLTLINVSDRTVLMETRLEDCARPHASWIVGERGFVTCQDEKAVAEVDLETGKSVARLPTQQNGTHVLSFEPRSRMLAATNNESASLTLINIDSGVSRIVKLADGSEGIQEVAGLFWVANAWDGSVTVVDPDSADVLANTGPLCSFPIALSPDTRNQVWVACFGSSELVAIDQVSYAVKRRVRLSGQPLNLLLHPERDIAYVSIPRDNAVAEVDLYSGKVVRQIRTGIEPDGLRWGGQ